MPRVIEAKGGKVVGPLRMKVAQTASHINSKTQTPKSMVHDHAFATSSNVDTRRGRFSRSVSGIKKNRSKSLPSSKEASLLLGKPPEVDGPSQEYSVDPSVAYKKSSTCRSQELQVAPPKGSVSGATVNKFDASDFETFDDECYPSITSTGPSRERFALALDTRFLTSITSNSCGNKSSSTVESMIFNCRVLAKSLHTRGISPCIISTTTKSDIICSHPHFAPENKRVAAALADLGLGIKSHKLLQEDDDFFHKALDLEDNTMYSQVDISSTKSTSGEFSIPLPLNATYSWLLFSAMVDAIIAEDASFTGFISSNTLKASKGPINVTIVCSDVSLFCDTNVVTHRTGVQAFLDHVTPYFQQGLLSSIAITAAMASGQLELSSNDNDENENRSPDLTSIEQKGNHQKAMQECVHMIEWTLHDFMTGIHPSQNDVTGSALRCSFTVVKNSIVAFMAISHSLVRAALIGCNTRLDCRLNRIDLPVSGDGTHCSISLEASYEVFPCSVHSLHTKLLSSDLDDLSTMHLTVIQIIPLSMIDASLLYGIPLVVHAALEHDYAQFQEMKLIVRSLFTVLQTQEQAILLRGSSHAQPHKRVIGKMEQIHSGISCPSEQFFLLMSQEVPSTVLGTENASARPSSGLLFRIAHCDHLLHDLYMSDCGSENYAQRDGDRDTEIQYEEYIENSLSTLSVGTYNPFTICIPKLEGSKEKNAKMVGDVEEYSTSKSISEETEAAHPHQVMNVLTPLALADANDSSYFNEMDVSCETAKLSIYDLNTTTDDMIEDVEY